MEEHLFNPALLQLTHQARRNFAKSAFVPGGDGGMGGGGDPAAGGGDPAAMGGGDPAAMGGGGGGGAAPPPSDPRVDQLMAQVQQMQQQQMAGGAGGGAGGAGGAQGLKPKIDVNVEIMQMKNLMAKICDHLGIQIPAQDMVATPDKLNQMAAGGHPASPPGTGGGGGGGGAIGGIPAMDPMQGAGMPGGEKAGSYRPNGVSFDTTGFVNNSNKAAAIARLRKRSTA